MSHEKIVQEVEKGLNSAGSTWHIIFEVSPKTVVDGKWLQIFIHSNADRGNAAAERQIIADVESNLSEKLGKELLLVPVQSLQP